MRIDLNADLGESWRGRLLGDDEALLGLVTSANIACGFHAGDAVTMARTTALASNGGVAVGAHVSYRDRDGFGRTFVDVDPRVLRDEVLDQLGALADACAAAGTRVAYVKPHGALYHAICSHPGQAGAVVAAISSFDASLPLLGLPDTVATRLAADAGVRTVVEAFADRAYTADGGLVPRGVDGAVLHDPDLVADRMLELVTTGMVEAVDGTRVAVSAESICVHGDSPGAVAMARTVRARLQAAGVVLGPFTP
ncbi:MAG TPA: 5-oxoprolinase subunit PxpA [Propionicimonas sp.]|uniref:LamB/YcsF family protein n=1 Tax=Propionicimonas sp. TaxID=1955623 RepID=UPI002F3E4442